MESKQPSPFSNSRGRIGIAAIFSLLMACSSLPLLFSHTKPEAPEPAPKEVEAGWRNLSFDSFDGDSSVFPDQTINDSNGMLVISKEGGKSKWTLTSRSDTVGLGIRPKDIGDVGDFFLSLEADQITDSAGCDFLIYFHAGQMDGYAFTIHEQEGAFSFEYQHNDFRKNELHASHTPSDAIHQDAPNRLAVKARGSSISLWINETPVAQVESDASLSGSISIMVLCRGNGIRAEFELDNFLLYGP